MTSEPTASADKNGIQDQSKNRIKVFGALLVLVAVLLVLLFVPGHQAPDPGVDVHLPSMVNVPREGASLKLDIPPEPTSEAEAR